MAAYTAWKSASLLNALQVTTYPNTFIQRGVYYDPRGRYIFDTSGEDLLCSYIKIPKVMQLEAWSFTVEEWDGAVYTPYQASKWYVIEPDFIRSSVISYSNSSESGITQEFSDKSGRTHYVWVTDVIGRNWVIARSAILQIYDGLSTNFVTTTNAGSKQVPIITIGTLKEAVVFYASAQFAKPIIAGVSLPPDGGTVTYVW